MNKHFNLNLLEVISRISAETPYLEIHCGDECGDESYYIDYETLEFFKDYMVAAPAFSNGGSVIIRYASITGIDGLDAYPDVDIYGFYGVTFETSIKFRQCNRSKTPLKFNQTFPAWN